MLLLAQNGWAGTFTTTVDEKNATHGKIYIKAEGGDIDYFNSEGCPNDICKNRFHTISFFDNVSGQWYYKFYIGNSSGGHELYYDITVKVTNGDGTEYTIGTIQKDGVKNGDSGRGNLKSVGDGEYVFYPSGSLMGNGIKQLKWEFRYRCWRNSVFKEDKYYQVTIIKNASDHGLKFNYTPMPQPTIAYSSNGYLNFKASGVPGHGFGYYYNWRYTRSDASSASSSSFNKVNLEADGSGLNTSSNKSNVDATSSDNRLSPFYSYKIEYYGEMHYDDDTFVNPTGNAYWKTAIPGYIYAYDLQMTEFDQWTKKVTISWKAQRTDKFTYNGESVNRNTDGRWEVYREYKDGNSTKSERIATIEGSKSDNDLHVTDYPTYYDTDYTYRVVFVPKMMYNSDFSWIEAKFKPTIQVYTKREVKINLSQDRDERIAGIKLDWTYNIQESGSTFRVERQDPESSQWVTLSDSQMSVITSQTTASYTDTTPSSNCEFYNYRVVASTLGTEFTSNKAENCNLPAGTRILSIDATKGTEEKVAFITWTVDQRGESDTYFDIQRRSVTNGKTGEWVKVGETHGTAAEYSFTDERVEAGSFYEYRVVAYGALCEEQVVKSSEMTTIGYCQARGTITGHISYGTGTSVSGVRLNLIKSGSDGEQAQFFSSYIHGKGDALNWLPDTTRYSKILKSDKPLSVQLWMAPVDSIDWMRVFSFDCIADVRLYKNGKNYKLYFYDGHGNAKDLGIDVESNRFSHLTTTYDGSQWKFYLKDGENQQTATATLSYSWTLANGKNHFRVGGVENNKEGSFDGLIDEVRLWSKTLSESEINTNYDRQLGGTENGLVLYWPLDEGINGYAFDVSKQNGISNENHATVATNVSPSLMTPKKLGLYGLTDEDGNYIIRGIPFDAGGTNYKVLPDFGVHEFNPSSRNLFVSPSSLTANHVDFTDKSSFPMRGYVYYAGTNIPAKGIYLYVDGDLVTSGGKVAQTNEEGFYEISVPIGEHFVEAKQTGHKMVNEGRWPTKGTYDFQAAVYQDFSDSTLVNFCGRVAGGEVQDDKPVGFGISTNNIGTAIVTLGLSNPNLSFNCEEGTTNDLDTIRAFSAQNPDTIKSTTWAGAGNEARYIYIQTDPKTGEFSALLPPLKYQVNSIVIPTNPDPTFADLEEIDLTNPLSFRVDTLLNINENVDSTQLVNVEIPTYKYNQKMVSTWYAHPTLEVTDANDEYNIGAFGVREYHGYEDNFGKVESIEVYRNDGGLPAYLYDYPIYQTMDKYTYHIKGYERYVNNDSGSPVYDDVPLKSQVLTVNNEMSSDQRIVVNDSTGERKEGEVYDLKPNQLVLDSAYLYQWTAGLPNTLPPYTRHVSITYQRRNRTYIWEGPDAYVFGTLPLGNNFVTEGPDEVLMVLRDPPGSNSSTTWERGRSNTLMEMQANGTDFGLGVDVKLVFGSNVVTSAGIGLALISEQDIQGSITPGFDGKVSYINPQTKEWAISTKEAISTSSDPEYVGANGDVYIGVSTNLILGDCKKVGFFRDSLNDAFTVKDSLAISINDSVTTSFMYSQREIELKQIPEWKKLRSQLLTIVDTEDDAKNYKNTTNECIYVTWKDPYSDELIANKTYFQIPAEGQGLEQDMVNYYSEQVKAWEKIMASNEEDKVNSMSPDSEKYDKKRNFSFDSGTTYTYSERNDTTYSDVNQWDYTFLGKVGGNTGFGIKGLSSVGFDITVNAYAGYHGTTAWGNEDENFNKYAEFTYNLVDNNIGADYTIDSYKSVSGWTDVFSVLGGQTYCPYEGEVVTKYFEPGDHVLSNATEQMQKPQIRISNGTQNPSTHAELTDIPAGQAGTYTLTLYNDSEFDMDMTYVLGVTDGTNPDGLQLLVDGVGIGNGRSYIVAPGEVITKTLQVKQSDLSILDYEDVELYLISDCQDDFYSINGVIQNTCSLGVHFKPSSSPVTLEGDLFVVNTVTSGTLDLKLTDFDRSFQNLKRMGVEYKADGASSWTQVQNYVFAKADSTSVSDIVVPATGDVRLLIDMSDNNSYPDGTYIFRAFTETPYGNENVRVYSEEVTVVKDMVRPTALGTPLPADGILNHGDDLMVEFNEDIVPGYINASNIKVTGKVNQQATTHEVSLHLSGDEPTAQTANDLYMRGNSTVAMWLKYTHGGTIFRHCGGDNALIFGIDSVGHLTAKIDSITKTSKLVMPKDEWVYMAYSYDAVTTALNMVVQHGTATDTIQSILGAGRTLEQVVYADDKHLYLGGNGFEGDIHDMRIYSICRDVLEVATEKYDDAATYTAGLMAHWPLDEGQGTKARDLRNNAHPFIIRGETWRIDNKNYAATVDSTKQQHLDLPIGGAATDSNESYVLEFWFHANGDVAGKTLFQAGTNINNNLRLYGADDNRLFLGYGAYIVPVSPTGFNPADGWHHFALNVIRGNSATVAIDGKRTAVVAEGDVPPLEGGKLVLGAGFKIPIVDIHDYDGFMSGAFDEVRIWKGVVKPEVIKDNMYNCLDTLTAGDKGLCVYFPMEKTTLVNGVNTVVPWAENMAPGQVMDGAMMGHFDLDAFSDNTPPLKKAPEMQTVIANHTASDRKIAIELQPNSLKEIEGTTLDVTVTKIFDKNGNISNPITWQVYVHQNTLGWQKDSVNVVKGYGETATFDVVIENKGNTTEQFTIDKLPSWLTTEQAEGELTPQSTQIIRFEVSKLAAVGSYDVNLALTGNNGIAEPLRVVMNVKGNAPDWAVDPNKYEDHMNMVAQIIIDGMVSENPESRLAAFIGDECVGLASPEKSRGSYFVPMTIYGFNDIHKNQVVTFKFWDASTNITYTGMNVDPIVKFKKDSVKGSYNYPVIITNSDLMEQMLTARNGWNWVSLYVEPENSSVNTVLMADGLLQNDMLKSKTQVTYYNGTEWTGSGLEKMNVGQMYKLQLQQPVNFVVKGAYKSPTEVPVTLNYGWNWIGYTPIATMPINEALGGVGALEGDYIKSKSEFAIFGPYGWEGNLKALEPGKGYMLFAQMEGTRTFTYPEPTQNAKAATFAPRRASTGYYFKPVDDGRYPDNMSIVAKLVCDGQVVDTAEVAAFIDGECRATTKAIDGLYYIMVQGEDGGQTIELRTLYNGEVATIDKALTFEGDTNVGLPWSPYVIDISTLTGITTLADEDNGDEQFFLPNGIRVDKSMLRRGQVYIARKKDGTTRKLAK